MKEERTVLDVRRCSSSVKPCARPVTKAGLLDPNPDEDAASVLSPSGPSPCARHSHTVSFRSPRPSQVGIVLPIS